MSQQRFIRCTHCGLPHEAELRTCPVTQKPLPLAKPRSRGKPSPSEEGYAWAHSLEASEGRRQELDPDDLEGFVGRIVEGKYRVDQLLGKGGMGAVYRATNERIDKPVALKVMYRGYAPGSAQEARFLREARIAGSLGHPNIVEVFDLGHLGDGKPYQVMELLEGQSLAQRIQTEGAIGEAEVLAIAEQVLSALEAAHERGVIHRDLKPDNVFLVERRGETTAKLLDFGVSKSVAEHSLSLTRTGVVVGTPYYLSPEQARGDTTLGPGIDIWAMGVLLYEAITGVLPFNAPSYEALLTKILESRPVPPSRFQPRLTPDVEALVLRALAPIPRDRPSSARAMLEEVRAVRARLRPWAPVEDRFAAFDLDGAGDSTVREELPRAPDDPTEISDRAPRRRPPGRRPGDDGSP